MSAGGFFPILTLIRDNPKIRCTGAAMNRQAVFTAVAVCFFSVAFTQNSTELESRGIVVAYMDRSVKPGDDFYHYANGEWIKHAQLPLDSGYVAIGGWMRDDLSNELSRKRSAELIQEAIKANAPLARIFARSPTFIART
jgi:hypothetical protein